MTDENLWELKNQVLHANLELQERNLVVYTFGNVSGIDRSSGLVVIKPSGVPYDELTIDKLVTVDLNGEKVDGDLRPSSDTLTHLELYRNFPDIGGVCHTHSPFATSWAQASASIPCLGTTHADYAPNEIPCTSLLTEKQVNGNYVLETGKKIVKTFDDYSYEHTSMVLVASHGPFTWGATPGKAVYHSVILEEIAKMAYYALTINPEIRKINTYLIKKHFNRKHGKDAKYGQKQ